MSAALRITTPDIEPVVDRRAAEVAAAHRCVDLASCRRELADVLAMERAAGRSWVDVHRAMLRAQFSVSHF